MTMSVEECAFLVGIRNAPDDNLIRLVFADWLDEHNRGTEASLIRVECELHDIENGRTDVAPERLAALRVESRAGRERIIAEMGSTIRAAVEQSPWRVKFDRGLIVEMNLGGLDISRLPDHLHVAGDLGLNVSWVRVIPDGCHVGGDLSGGHNVRLPEGFRIGGSLDLRGAEIERLPDSIHVGGDLDLSLTMVAELPDGLCVPGNLNLDGTPITRLPTGFQVGGAMSARQSRLTALPEGFGAGGNLDLSHAPVRHLPDNLHVRGDLLVQGTHLSELPKNLRVDGNLDLSHTRIAALPDDLHVGGFLQLYYTRITAAGFARLAEQPFLSNVARQTGRLTAGYQR